jgi:putative transposase
MSTPREPFEPGCWYHVFNHARGSDVIFSIESDYKTFLSLTEKYILPIARVYAYCLMPNHFHFLVQIKDITVSEKHKDKNLSNYIAHQWGTLQNTFTKKLNYKRGTRGGLFCQSVDRNLINSEEYRQMAVVYIHNNPVKHVFCTSPEDWKFSSYNSIISEGFTKVERDEVISWFETRENFIFYHKSNADEIYREKFNLR